MKLALIEDDDIQAEYIRKEIEDIYQKKRGKKYQSKMRCHSSGASGISASGSMCAAWQPRG